MEDNHLLNALNNPETDNYAEVRPLINKVIDAVPNIEAYETLCDELFETALKIYSLSKCIQLTFHVSEMAKAKAMSNIAEKFNKS